MLKLENLCKTYPNGTHALEDVTLDLAAGEIVALVGGSGCGKTTMLRMVSGLEHPSRGLVAVDGERISAPHEAVGIIFQEPRLLPWLTVAQNIGFGLEMLGKPRAEIDARVATLYGLDAEDQRWAAQSARAAASLEKQGLQAIS